MIWRLGTMGFAYQDWRGSFYPARLPGKQWLDYYARQFPALEMNTTFHALPTPARLQQWRDTVGSDFRLAVKMARQITHDAPLAAGVDPLRRFVDTVRALGPALGPLLLQLPPTVTIESLPALDRLLAAVPSDVRCAVEFRSPCWLRPATLDVLRAHRACLVGLDHVDHPAMLRVVPTTDLLYIRLVGKHGRFPAENREVRDPTAHLAAWLRRIRAAAAAHTIREVWVLFNNDYAGHAPATLRRFARAAEVPLPAADREAARPQLRLFEG